MADYNARSFERPDDAIVVRYLNGTCDSAELAQLERWLDSDPTHRAELELLGAAWNPPAAPEADPDGRMWQWITARMDQPLARPTIVQARAPFRSQFHRLGLVAAVVAIMVAGALALRLTGRRPSGGVGRLPASSMMRELVTARGERSIRNLPDGTRIVLGPDSRLQIPVTFATAARPAGARDVYLQRGEVFFQVTHDPAHPFRVHTAQGVVEDLGTEFVVTAYPETKATHAVVVSGVVALRSRGSATADSVTLRAGDLGRIDASEVMLLAHNVDVASYIGWTTGNLVFDEMPLDQAVRALSRWYNLNIELADTALAKRRFSATFHDEPVAQVLRVLEIALDARAEHRGQMVVLRPNYSTTTPNR